MHVAMAMVCVRVAVLWERRERDGGTGVVAKALALPVVRESAMEGRRDAAIDGYADPSWESRGSRRAGACLCRPAAGGLPRSGVR